MSSSFSVKYAVQALDKFTPTIRKAMQAVDKLNATTVSSNNRAVAAISASHKAQESLSKAVNQTRSAREKLMSVEAKALAASTPAVDRAISNMRKVETEVMQLRSTYESAAASQKKLTNGRVALGRAATVAEDTAAAATTRHAHAIRRLSKADGLRAKLSERVQRSSSKMLQSRAQLMSLALGFAASVTPLIVFAKAETAIARLQRVAGGGLSKDFIKSIQKAAPELGVFQTELLKTVEDITKLGIAPTEALKLARSITQFSLITEAPLDKTIEQFGNLNKILNVSTKEIPRVTSLILSLGDATTKDPKDVVLALSKAASAFGQIGSGIEDAAAMSAFAAEQLGSASEGATAIRRMIQALVNAKKRKFLPKGMMESFKRDPVEFTKRFKQFLSKQSEAVQSAILESLTVRGKKLVLMMMKNLPRLEEIFKVKRDAFGSTEALVMGVARLTGTLGFRATKTASKFLNLGEAIGKSMAPSANSFLEGFANPVLEALTAIASKHKTAVGAVTSLTAAMAGMAAVLVAGGLLKAMTTFGLAFGADLLVAAATNPIILAMAGLTAAAVALPKAHEHLSAIERDPEFQRFKPGGVGSKIQDFFTGGTDKQEVEVTIKNETSNSVEVKKGGALAAPRGATLLPGALPVHTP